MPGVPRSSTDSTDDVGLRAARAIVDELVYLSAEP